MAVRDGRGGILNTIKHDSSFESIFSMRGCGTEKRVETRIYGSMGKDGCCGARPSIGDYGAILHGVESSTIA